MDLKYMNYKGIIHIGNPHLCVGTYRVHTLTQEVQKTGEWNNQRRIRNARPGLSTLHLTAGQSLDLAEGSGHCCMYLCGCAWCPVAPVYGVHPPFSPAPPSSCIKRLVLMCKFTVRACIRASCALCAFQAIPHRCYRLLPLLCAV